MTSASSHSADYWPLELLTPLRTITCLFRGYSLSFLPVGRLVFRLLLRRLFLLIFRRFIAHGPTWHGCRLPARLPRRSLRQSGSDRSHFDLANPAGRQRMERKG